MDGRRGRALALAQPRIPLRQRVAGPALASRRTNLALLALLPLAALTGFGCFLVGSGAVSPVVVAHGVIGLAIAVLAPWKQVIVRRGLGRRRRGRATSVLLLVAVLVALVSGLAHSTGLLRTSPYVTAMQVHVGAALVAVVPVVLHVRRRMRVRRTDVSRRNLLRGGALLLGAGVAYAGLEVVGAVVGWPGAARRATGSYERASGDPEQLPETIWLFDRVPSVDLADWRLTVVAAGHEQRLSLGDLPESSERTAVLLDCTGGWYSWQSWRGVPVAALLPAGATGSVRVTSRTGYARRLPLTDDLLLATHLGDALLTPGHGAPLRLVVPGRRGFHWVKWVDRVEWHPDVPWWLELPLPLH